jgi:hypothetical protein
MLSVLVLVCSLVITPDIRECDRTNAVHVIRLPETYYMPATCFIRGEAYIAETEIGQTLTEGEVVKVQCFHERKS